MSSTETATSHEDQRKTLCRWMIDRDALEVTPELKAAVDGWNHPHALIARAFIDLKETDEPTDFVTLSDELQRRGQYDEVGGLSYLSGILADDLW